MFGKALWVSTYICMASNLPPMVYDLIQDSNTFIHQNYIISTWIDTHTGISIEQLSIFIHVSDL